MGSVHAKERRKNVMGFDPFEAPLGKGQSPCDSTEASKTETKSINLQGITARVDRVNVDGLKRTKNDIVASTVKDLFNAQNFEEVITNAHVVRQKLQKLGCFKNITIQIDTSSGPGSSPNGFEVNYEVKELNRVSGGFATHVSNQNEVILTLGGFFPNLFGRGESLRGEMSYGSGQSNTANVTLVKPFVSSHDAVGSLSAFRAYNDFAASGYNLLENGLLADFDCTSFPGWNHKLQYEAVWRKMGAGTRQSSFFIRDKAGSTLKSSLRHVWSIDTRNSPVVPTCGDLLQMTTEFAGLGGNVNFLKNEVRLQTNIPKGNFVFQAGLNLGLLNPIGEEEVGVIDSFFLGGPLSFRGFLGRSIGPKSGDNYIGANMYWATGLHVYAPLPFRPGEGGFGDHFKLHAFVNTGNIGKFDFSGVNEFVNDQRDNLRVAAGLGFVLKLGSMARVELNYVHPLKMVDSDGPVQGIQFGIGVDFL